MNLGRGTALLHLNHRIIMENTLLDAKNNGSLSLTRTIFRPYPIRYESISPLFAASSCRTICLHRSSRVL